MLDIRLNEKWDLDYRDGGLFFVSGVARVAQQVKQALLILLGEYFLDTRIGIPYREAVWVKNPQPTLLRTIFTETLLAVEGVTRVVDLRLAVDDATRRLFITAVVESRYGEVKVRLPVKEVKHG
ncbi:hypothetical protein SGGMMB4_01639 [Sodalis glossinidius str. 'morsitans']|uniref:Uncharacterized protein n=1 Tax=Sodalis glossinidius (strain morsitans) TaxID=343509 RepID=A0A193QHW5_SODGM|nr:hypothetical protein [Sodalis glossinidius]CRL44510.1 hypothetical protein SGGMMB4_01639 [Sodalis glossinidius str. 'morsitans']